jgi:hypothetical protein
LKLSASKDPFRTAILKEGGADIPVCRIWQPPLQLADKKGCTTSSNEYQ